MPRSVALPMHRREKSKTSPGYRHESAGLRRQERSKTICEIAAGRYLQAQRTVSYVFLPEKFANRTATDRTGTEVPASCLGDRILPGDILSECALSLWGCTEACLSFWASAPSATSPERTVWRPVSRRFQLDWRTCSMTIANGHQRIRPCFAHECSARALRRSH